MKSSASVQFQKDSIINIKIVRFLTNINITFINMDKDSSLSA